MKIYCQDCDTYVGEIRDGTIKKLTSYLCGECNGQLVIDKPKEDKYSNDYALNQLKSMFGIK